MKTIFYILTIGVTLLLTSCEGFLDREPLDQLTQGSFYNTAADANLATLSLYSVPQGVNWYGKSWMITEIPSDNTTAGGNDPDFSPIDNFTVNADNGPNAEFWTERFRLVTLANQVLTYVPPITMDEDIKQSYLAEAKFMRAFAYLDLVRIYGNVPIITDVPTIEADLLIYRDEAEVVYSFIISDLIEALEYLPISRSASDLGRATSGAAKALLAKTYLTTKENQKVIDLCREIITSNQYRLMEDYGDNWLRDVSDNNAESIFQIQYVGCGPGGTGNALQAFFAPWGQGITKGSDGWGSQVPTGPSTDNPGTTVKDIYTEDDKRKYHTIMTPADYYPDINSSDGGYTYPAIGASRTAINIKKYVIGGGPDVCFMSTPQNLHVIRYAEVLLMLAEAACANNGGISVTPDVVDAFNAVRKRAGLDVVGVVTTDIVFEERRREFAFENKRWFDLLRTGKVQDIMLLHGKQMQDFHKLFPIPSQELAINPNLTQNPGY